MRSEPIYVATSNPGKLRDFAAAAKVHGFAIEPMPCLDRIAPPVEDELTFTGNACLKAVYYSQLAPGFAILADDSGLEVEELNGRPGVRSARYAEDAGVTTPERDEANNVLLLKNLVGVPAERRGARYRCALAFAKDGECLYVAEGTVDGRIAEHPQGSGGFGYDPLFHLPLLGKTMAELDPQTKDKLSHRGRALRSLFDQLKSSVAPEAQRTEAQRTKE